MQFLTDLKKAAKGEREKEFSFDEDGEKGKADKWLEKINSMSKKIQSVPTQAREKMQKMREPKDEEKAAYFEEAEQEKAKAATWWSGCDPKEDPDVQNWSRSASSETIQSDANAESVSSGDESWPEEGESEEENSSNVDLKTPLRMSQIDFESLQKGGTVVAKPLESIAEAEAKPDAKAEAKVKVETKPAKEAAPQSEAKPSKTSSAEADKKPEVKPEEAAASSKDPFGSSDEEPKDKRRSTGKDSKAPEERKPKKGKKPVKSRPVPVAKDPFADSDSDPGGNAANAAKATAPTDPFADSDVETGPLLPSQPQEVAHKRPSQAPQVSETESKSLSSAGDGPKKVKRPKGRPSKAEDGTTSSGKKPVGRPKKKAAPVVAAQDSDGEDAKF